jgi:hypothetical protein
MSMLAALLLLLLRVVLLHRRKCPDAACPSGHALTPAGTCRACPAGTYNVYGNGTFPTDCTPCEPGTYQPEAGAFSSEYFKCNFCIMPGPQIDGYKSSGFPPRRDNTTGKTAPQPGSTACDVPWCVAGIAPCSVLQHCCVCIRAVW